MYSFAIKMHYLIQKYTAYLAETIVKYFKKGQQCADNVFQGFIQFIEF